MIYALLFVCGALAMASGAIVVAQAVLRARASVFPQRCPHCTEVRYATVHQAATLDHSYQAPIRYSALTRSWHCGYGLRLMMRGTPQLVQTSYCDHYLASQRKKVEPYQLHDQPQAVQ